jgi:hypothetical protein
MNSGLTDTTVFSLVAKGTNLFAGTNNGGIFRSTNNGTNWTAVNSGLGGYTQIMTFGLSGTNLFAGSYGGHLFLSTDDGATWTNVGTGLGTSTIEAFAVSGPYLLAGTSGVGVWRRPLSEMVTSVGERAYELPQQFELSQNYPNPFNPLTVISYRLPVAGFVILKVYDILGREVAALVDQEMPPGVHQVTWDGAEVSTGVYFYRLQVNPGGGGPALFTETKRLVVLR